MDPLLAFRSAVIGDEDRYQVLNSAREPAANLKEAVTLKINSQEFDLNQQTAFKSANEGLGFIDLRTVVNCWKCKGLSVPQYIATSDELGIPNLKFLERTDLIEWLEGTSTNSEYISTSADSAGAPGGGDGDVDMPDYQEEESWKAVDRGVLVDHTSILHGDKLNDFASVAALSHKNLVSEYRNATSGRPSSSAGRSSSEAVGSSGSKLSMTPLKPTKGKDPIILLSPSPSSLLNMANVQDFLEKGVYTPTLKSSTSPNLLRITRASKLIGPRTKFIVVDSVEQFKPDYWDRVVAVFVTGQPWQLRSYKWQDANSLFQHILGFGLVFKNDPVPETLKQWNVKIEPIERNARFRDREVVERIWERIEGHMIARGWPIASTA